MPRNPGVLIADVSEVGNVEATKKRILRIKGVVRLEHNHLMQKIEVTYHADEARLREIESELHDLLRQDRGHGRQSRARKTRLNYE